MNNLPQHIAIIMDGNGRWAKKRGLPRIAGHRAGAKNIREVVRACSLQKEIKVLTLWAFGTDNWGRPNEEVGFLMKLMANTLEKEANDLNKNNIRLMVIGDRKRLPIFLQDAIVVSEKLTEKNTGLTLVIAISYSGRWDITEALHKLANKVQNGQLVPEDIDENLISKELCLGDLPTPDLFIRTGGEMRISNYFLWQLAFTELYFTDVFWPDFNKNEFAKAINDYLSRERRFGLISEQITEHIA